MCEVNNNPNARIKQYLALKCTLGLNYSSIVQVPSFLQSKEVQ